MNETNRVYNTICNILDKIGNRLNDSKGKAILSNLRYSIGKDISQVPIIWEIFFEYLPNEYIESSKFEKEEKVILTILQLYSIYQQGEQNNVFSREGVKFCESLGKLRNNDNTESIDRRFNVMITASTYDEFVHHLRQMLKLSKSKSKGLEKINFALLGQDLYKIFKFNDNNVKINWGKQYYSYFNKNERGDVENDK